MELDWLGTAGIILHSGDTAVAFDPFGGIYPGDFRSPSGKLSIEEACRGVDGVLVTHGHIDHIYHIPRVFGGTSTPIYSTAAPRKTLARHGVDEAQLRLITPDWAGKIGSFSVRTYRSRHCRYDLALIMRTALSRRVFRHLIHLIALGLHIPLYRQGGEILFYEVESGDCRVQIMGSLNLDPDTVYPTGADVLVLPFQGRSDLSRWAFPLVRRLAPRAILLDHYDDSFPPLSDNVDTSDFCMAIERELEIPCKPLRIGETVRIGDEILFKNFSDKQEERMYV